MYSVVLMMALSSGAQVPASGFFAPPNTERMTAVRHELYRHNRGCFGGAGRHGCFGGARRHGRFGCYGCYGGDGCYGGWNSFGCYGYRGCYGGSACYGCYGCYGGYGSFGCYGGYGGYGCFGGYGCYGIASGPVTAASMATASMVSPSTTAPATLVVQLPADARLTIDNVPTQSQTATRTFVSPALASGQEFTYTLKAEIMRDGKHVAVTKQVAVQAGKETRVSIDFPPTGLTRK